VKQQVQLFNLSMWKNMIIVVVAIGLLSLRIPACRACAAAATDAISAGQVLSGSDTLVSSNGKFALGFFRPSSKSSSHDASNNWYLGVWFNTVSKFTPAWVANGDRPATGPTSPELAISADGNLVIIDQTTRSIVWSTQANTSTGNNTRTVLLKTGNLVLHSSSNSCHILWQSFDYPTDTHLAGAKLGRDKVTGLNHRLVSWKNSVDPAPGLYTYELHETNGSAQFSLAVALKNSSVPYWFSGEWNGHYFSSIPEMTGRRLIDFKFVNNDQELYFTYTVLDDAKIMRFALGTSGQTKILLWVEHAQDWVPAYTNPKDPCDVYGICGPFTTCDQNKLPWCSCMEGFSIRSSDDRGLEGPTGGCTRNTPLECGSTGVTKDGFHPMPCVHLPNSGHMIGDPISAHGCAQVCLGNCNCTAYSYGSNRCFVWDNELTNVKQQQCSHTDNNDQSTLYLRLAARELRKQKNNHWHCNWC
jgi:hypothetical protein